MPALGRYCGHLLEAGGGQQEAVLRRAGGQPDRLHPRQAGQDRGPLDATSLEDLISTVVSMFLKAGLQNTKHAIYSGKERSLLNATPSRTHIICQSQSGQRNVFLLSKRNCQL